jgi:hypothetical protein
MTAKLAIPSENQEQRALVGWLSYHPIVREYFCKNNNEGKRTPAQGFNLKLMGLRPGVSDLALFWPTKTYHGLWLEVKRNMKYPPSARRSDTWIAQEAWIERMQKVGYAGEFCYGWEDGKRIIEAYLLT